MKKFLINTFLLSTALGSQTLVYPVSCSKSKGDFIDSNRPEEIKILQSEFKYDFFKEGVITEEKVCDKIKKIADNPKNKKYFEHDFLPYSTSKWNNNDYYVQIDLTGEFYPEIKLHALYEDTHFVPSFYLNETNISYLADNNSVNKIYDSLVKFHTEVTSSKYYSDLEQKNNNITLKQISQHLYDDFFKTLFPDVDSDNINNSAVSTYKIFEKCFYYNQLSFKYNLIHNSISEQNDYSAAPFMVQAIDTQSNFSLDLCSFNNNINNLNNVDNNNRKNYEGYERITDEFINKNLSSLIDFNNVKFNFNWSVSKDDEFKDLYIFNHERTNFIKSDLIKKDKETHTDFDESNNLEKSKNVEIEKIPAYKNGSINSANSLKQSELHLNNFNNIKSNENAFFNELFLENIKGLFFYRESFNLFNSLLNSLSIKSVPNTQDDNLILFVNKTITLSIDNSSSQFNVTLDNNKIKIRIVDENNWTDFFAKLKSNTNKVLSIKLDGEDDSALIKGQFQLNVNLN